jgi:protein-L-isoaspartate(D-aspartate) O-methyltransferase
MDKQLIKSKRKLFRGIRRRIPSPLVVNAMESVPRESFVPLDYRHMAYLDLPLTIGEGQTISQPYIVAMMTAALGLAGNEKVLEVGTGSGYQAAILSRLLPQGYLVSVELIPSLAIRAQEVLDRLECTNVDVVLAGAALGCPERGPYDAIVVTAASPRLPETLLSQLAVGGRIIIPVGTMDQQELVLAIRTDEGLSVQTLGPCRFVPLIGQEAFPRAQ